MKEIVVFSIGPVQSFIAAARRTQDLWAGSRLLSDIMAHSLNAAQGDILVFPQQQPTNDWPPSLPNRAVSVSAAGQGTDIAMKMEKAAEDRWNTIAAAVKTWFNNNVIEARGSRDWSAIWDRQVKNWLEVYWAVYLWDESRESYGVAYGRASELLDARKLLRRFPAHEEYDVKSTLDGAYQALRGSGVTAQAFWEEAAEKAPRGDVRQGERLSAIDVVKRFAQDAGMLDRPETRFPSTSAVACADYRLALMERWDTTGPTVTKFIEALEKLMEAFAGAENRLRFGKDSREPIERLREEAGEKDMLLRLLRFDGDYFYRDFYTEARFLDQLGRKPTDNLGASQLTAIADARSALGQLYDCTDNLKIPRPSIYYSVIALDGDKMGKKLSDEGMTQHDHRLVSAAMAEFARDKVPSIAGKSYPAVWVYAGGDDALVLSPIACALDIAEELRKAFRETVGPPLKQKVSASAGIAIVHQQNPMQAGIELARQAEEHAKGSHGRDAVVVHRQTRGGAPTQTGSKWEPERDGGSQPVVELITKLQNHIISGRLSGKFAYELREEAATLDGVDSKGRQAEMERLLRRHTPKDHRLEVLPLAANLAALAAAFGQNSAVHVADWAVLARFLATGGRNE